MNLSVFESMNIYNIINPADYITSGSERDVYKYNKDYVIKVSKLSSENHNQNIREYEFYNVIKNKKISNLFAEIKILNGDQYPNLYIIQEKLNTNKNIPQREIEEWLEEVRKYNIIVHDDRPVNYGYRGNQLVMLDYAGCYIDSK